MPLGRYDKYFGGQRGAAEKALAAMKRSYGTKGGEHVFYGTIAKRQRKQQRTQPRRRRR
jgi:hypothetical protein